MKVARRAVVNRHCQFADSIPDVQRRHVTSRRADLDIISYYHLQ